MMEIVSEVPVKVKTRVQGHLCTLEDGSVVYLAKRKHKNLNRMGHPSISAAMLAGECAWAFDEMMLFNLRAKKIAVIGVRCEDVGDIYTTALSNYFDGKITKTTQYTGIGSTGERKKCLPLQYFQVTKGLVELPVEKILA